MLSRRYRQLAIAMRRQQGFILLKQHNGSGFDMLMQKWRLSLIHHHQILEQDF